MSVSEVRREMLMAAPGRSGDRRCARHPGGAWKEAPMQMGWFGIDARVWTFEMGSVRSSGVQFSQPLTLDVSTKYC